MAFCRKCGAEIDDEAVICPKCGVSQTTIASVSGGAPVVDKPDAGLNFISFLIPLIGLIYYAVNVSKLPKRSDSCGKWALVGLILGIIGTVAISFSVM